MILGSCPNGCVIPSFGKKDMTSIIFDDFLKTMIELKPSMANILKSQQVSSLKRLQISLESKDMPIVQNQLRELFSTSVIVTVDQKTLDTHSNQRQP